MHSSQQLLITWPRKANSREITKPLLQLHGLSPFLLRGSLYFIRQLYCASRDGVTIILHGGRAERAAPELALLGMVVHKARGKYVRWEVRVAAPVPH